MKSDIPRLDDSGAFWFFNQDNVELVVKVLEGCSINNHFWVFISGLTDVFVEIVVVDTMTGVSVSYVNALGNAFVPIQDTRAFSTCG